MQNLLKNSQVKCSIDGCDRLAMYIEKELCQKHYFRIMRNGHASLLLNSEKEKGIRKRKEFFITPNGYKRIYSLNHPLARNNWVFEHRFIMYEKYNENLPPCEVCGKSINWKNCHIDHIDDNRLNNEESNLRPLCRPCNTTKGTKGINNPRAYILTINGVSKTVPEWAKSDGVKLCAASIRRRSERGLSAFDSVYGDKITHNGKESKDNRPRKTQFKHERKNAIRITIDGVLKTASEWSKHPDCKVKVETIVYRIKNGYEHKYAVFAKPKTGKNVKKFM